MNKNNTLDEAPVGFDAGNLDSEHNSIIQAAVRTILSMPLPVLIGAFLVLFVFIMSFFVPTLISADPMLIDPLNRLAKPSLEHWLGTDMLGRDIFSRAAYGGRASLSVGFAVMAVAVVAGVILGMASGYVRALDALIMRIMDGMMAIPAIMLAIAMIAINGASLTNVIIAISIPNIPRIARLVRSIVLTVREEPYVEAAVTAGTPIILLLIRHVLPNTVAPLIILASYVCARAILAEAALGFLGAGLPPNIPSWGNMVAEGRIYFQLIPLIVFVPGILLSITVLGINMIGDGLRDELDPKLKKGAKN